MDGYRVGRLPHKFSYRRKKTGGLDLEDRKVKRSYAVSPCGSLVGAAFILLLKV